MLHVLVVEDDADTAATCAMLLRMYGHEVEVAADGPSALRAVQSNRPDVMLLDLAMPKMDGFEVAQQVRYYRNGNRRPLIIAVTGYGDKASQLRSQESGIDLHLVKPVDPAQLEDVLKRLQMSVMPSAERRLPQSHRRIWLGPSLQHWSERAMLRKRVEMMREMVGGTQALRARLNGAATRAERMRIRDEMCRHRAQFLDASEHMNACIDTGSCRLRWGRERPAAESRGRRQRRGHAAGGRPAGAGVDR